MEEIKFRARRLDGSAWAYGGLIQCDDYCIIDQGNEVYVEEEYNFRGDTHLFKLSGVMCDEKTIGQFTGNIDKNKKEIFSGDLLKDQDGVVYEIWYSEETAAFMAEMVKPANDMVDILGGYDTERCFEVIGNIYDNTDLLED